MAARNSSRIILVLILIGIVLHDCLVFCVLHFFNFILYFAENFMNEGIIFRLPTNKIEINRRRRYISSFL